MRGFHLRAWFMTATHWKLSTRLMRPISCHVEIRALGIMLMVVKSKHLFMRRK
jgi:hypothetical protein